MSKGIFTIVLGTLFFVNIGEAQVGLVVNQEPWQLIEHSERKPIKIANTKSPPRNFGATESRGFKTTLSPAPLFDTGWFCKLDANLDMKLPYKLRFRLGEYHYTRQLEYGEDY